MPVLETETIRLKQDQQNRLRSDFKGRSSFLIRELLDIYFKSPKPGMDILLLRSKLLREKLNGKSSGRNGTTG